MISGWSACRRRILNGFRALRKRGQSETLGVALLTGIVVILVALVGLFLFADFGANDEEQLLANIQGDVDATNITLSHEGGDTFEADNVEVILTGDTTAEYSLGADFTEPGGSNSRLEPGDTWNNEVSEFILGEGRLLVVHEPSNTVLLDQPYSVETAEEGVTLFMTNLTTGPGGDPTNTGQTTIYQGPSWDYSVRAQFADGSTLSVAPANVSFETLKRSKIEPTGSGELEAKENGTVLANVTVDRPGVDDFDEMEIRILDSKPSLKVTSVSASKASSSSTNSAGVGTQDVGASSGQPGTLADPIMEGDNISVEVEVEATGPVKVTGNLTVDPGELGKERILTVTTDEEGTIRTEEFETNKTANPMTGPYSWEWEDAGQYSIAAGVEGLNQPQKSESVTVNARPFYAITDVSTNTELLPFISFNFNTEVTVTNIGTIDGEDREISGEFDAGLPVDLNPTESVNLSGAEPGSEGGGESKTITFAPAGPITNLVGLTDELNLSISTVNDSFTDTVNITEEDLTVSITTDSISVVEGNSFNVPVEVTSPSTVDKDVSVTVDAGFGKQTDTSIGVNDGEKTVSFSTQNGDEGDYTVTAELTEDSSTADTADLTIEDSLQSISLSVDNTEPNVGDNPSYTVEAEYTSGNTQDVTDSATVTSNDTGVVTVNGGANELNAQSLGVAEITADFNGKTASKVVAVGKSINFNLDLVDVTDEDGSGSTTVVPTSVSTTGGSTAVASAGSDRAESVGADSARSETTANGSGGVEIAGDVTTEQVTTNNYRVLILKVPDKDEVTLTIEGAGGGGGAHGFNLIKGKAYGGGDGGKISGTFDVSSFDELRIHLAAGGDRGYIGDGEEAEGGLGYYNGGNGGQKGAITGEQTSAGAGGGASALVGVTSSNTKVELALVGGGGGGSAVDGAQFGDSDNSGGGGGAPNGEGGYRDNDGCGFGGIIAPPFFADGDAGGPSSSLGSKDVGGSGGTVTLEGGLVCETYHANDDAGDGGTWVNSAYEISVTEISGGGGDGGVGNPNQDAASGEDATVSGSPNINIESIGFENLVLDNPGDLPSANFDVEYTLKNNGFDSGTETVELKVQGTGSTVDDDETVTLSPGETESGTLTLTDVGKNGFNKNGKIEFTVEISDDSKTGSAEIVTSEVIVKSVNTDDIVVDDEGDLNNNGELEVEYTLENKAGSEKTESFVDLKVEGTGDFYDDTDNDVTVPAGGTTSGTLTANLTSANFNIGETVDFTVDLFDFENSNSSSAQILSSAEFVIDSINYDEIVVDHGETLGDQELAVNYTVTNVGGVTAEKLIDLKVDGTDRKYDDTDSLEVSSSETVTGTLTLGDLAEDFSIGDTVSFSVKVFDTNGDVANGSVTIKEADIVLDSISAPDNVESGGSLPVVYNVTNEGTGKGTTDVELSINECSGIQATDVITVDPGETETVGITADVGCTT